MSKTNIKDNRRKVVVKTPEDQKIVIFCIDLSDYFRQLYHLRDLDYIPK